MKFVKELYAILDQISLETEPLERYCKRKFDFSAREWHRFPAVHIVNFISNCTKHQDGFCKLDNDKFKKPKPLENIPDSDKIIRTSKEFNEDVNNLVSSISELLTKIIAYSNLLRTMESGINSTYEWNDQQLPLYDTVTKTQLQEQIDTMEFCIKGLISIYRGER